MNKIRISDVTMKQTGAEISLSFKEKIELSKLLDKLGVDLIELEPIEVTAPTLCTESATEASAELGETGCVRITYTNNVSNVRYVTKVEELPDYEALAKYDAAYFENKALLVILETTASGSVQVGIESIADGTVTLSHEMSGDAGTTDMATWLLWAEVDQGLEGNWKVANPALANTAVSY